MGPTKYVKKLVIEAKRWTSENHDDVLAWLTEHSVHHLVEPGSGRLHVGTTEPGAALDRYPAKNGDYVIRGVKGEFSVCDADVFVETYDKFSPDDGPGSCCLAWDRNEILFRADLAIAYLDRFPVAREHILIVVRRHVRSFSDLTTDEVVQVHELFRRIKKTSMFDDFTLAVNDGPYAGQTIPHFHLHVIGRAAGDIPEPRGGVRRMFVPAEQDAWTNYNPTPTP